jgi:hypothetical protein
VEPHVQPWILLASRVGRLDQPPLAEGSRADCIHARHNFRGGLTFSTGLSTKR